MSIASNKDDAGAILVESRRPMAQWDKRAMVRSQARHYGRHDMDGHFFKPSLIRPLSDPELAHLEAPDRRNIEILHLSRYLYGVEQIETLLVNPALLELVKLDLPRLLRLDAYKIYTDEGYHALMSAELTHEVSSRHGLDRIKPEFPSGLRRILERIAELPEGPRRLALVTAASLNETLISSNLAQADDPSLVPAVREMILQHRTDETKHHGYFLTVFPEVWRKWPEDERRIVVPLIAWFLVTLLSTDFNPLARDLETLGLKAEAAIVAAACREGPTTEELLRAGCGSLAMLSRCGLMDCAAVRQGFAAEGFEL
jgi:P-aminobenzoate N-oxygenase AurF